MFLVSVKRGMSKPTNLRRNIEICAQSYIRSCDLCLILNYTCLNYFRLSESDSGDKNDNGFCVAL